MIGEMRFWRRGGLTGCLQSELLESVSRDSHVLAGFEVVDSEEGGHRFGELAEGVTPGGGFEGDGVDRFREFG